MNTKHHQYGQIVIRQIGDSLCENFRIGISSQVYNIFRYIMYLGWWKSSESGNSAVRAQSL